MSLRDAYAGKRVLVTGHTGFKGSWLSLWLTRWGAQVCGLSLDPVAQPNHWSRLGLKIDEERCDIRDAGHVQRIVREFAPEIVFHLAAQSLVRRSYLDPLETWSTNVQGTANVLDACRAAPQLRAIVVVTSDKCYANEEWVWGYRENDRLGGNDPYSASKAAAELVAASYRKAFFSEPQAPVLATGRAGNVVGGGDWAVDRLVPDLVRAVVANTVTEIRSPNSTRPWQHVLDSLSGYVLLAAKLFVDGRRFAGEWNFGPIDGQVLSVADVVHRLEAQLPGLRWRISAEPGAPEAHSLRLDSSKARSSLGWRPVWNIDEALAKTAQWYARYLTDDAVISDEQLGEYLGQLEALCR